MCILPCFLKWIRGNAHSLAYFNPFLLRLRKMPAFSSRRPRERWQDSGVSPTSWRGVAREDVDRGASETRAGKTMAVPGGLGRGRACSAEGGRDDPAASIRPGPISSPRRSILGSGGEGSWTSRRGRVWGAPSQEMGGFCSRSCGTRRFRRRSIRGRGKGLSYGGMVGIYSARARRFGRGWNNLARASSLRRQPGGSRS